MYYWAHTRPDYCLYCTDNHHIQADKMAEIAEVAEVAEGSIVVPDSGY